MGLLVTPPIGTNTCRFSTHNSTLTKVLGYALYCRTRAALLIFGSLVAAIT